MILVSELVLTFVSFQFLPDRLLVPALPHSPGRWALRPPVRSRSLLSVPVNNTLLQIFLHWENCLFVSMSMSRVSTQGCLAIIKIPQEMEARNLLLMG